MNLLPRFLRRDPRPGPAAPAGPLPPSERRAVRALLARSPAFAQLARRTLDVVAGAVASRRAQRGQALLRQGDAPDGLWVIREGHAEVRVHLETGGERVLAQVGPGEVVGEMALLTGEPRNADVVAVEDVEALFLDLATFEELAREWPEIAVVLTELLGERLGRGGLDGLRDKRIGGYRIDRCLGRGGMAVVYEAEEESSRRHVALKMMSHRLVYDRDALDRFEREADLAASLDHPGVARVLGRFEAYRTRCILLELCDGPSLAQFIRWNHPLPEDAVRAILGQIAVGLDHVHRRGVLHRDLKPSNAMVLQDGSVKLTDFGLAVPALGGSITQSGTIVGTPSYMPPEQLAGKPLDVRADYYAFGCIAWELLTGSPLFEENDLTALIYRKLTWGLPSPEEIRPDLPADLHELLARTLAKTAEERTFDPTVAAPWATRVDPALLAGIPRPGDEPPRLSATAPSDELTRSEPGIASR